MMASRDPNDLCPELRPIYFQWLNAVKDAGHDVLTICTWRSPEEQLVAFNSGKSKRLKGPHNYVDDNGKPASRAFDFALLINGKITWSTTIDNDQNGHPDYIEIGQIGKDLGLEYGGDWPHLKDYDHLQLKGA
jgi:peptidoglycan L-alanyl-D-glutamate endopeptidase CwlK